MNLLREHEEKEAARKMMKGQEEKMMADVEGFLLRVEV